MTGDFRDPAIHDWYLAARQIGADIGWNVMTIGEDGQPVRAIAVKLDKILLRRPGPDEAPMLAGHFKAIAIAARDDGRAPAFGKAGNSSHLIGNAIAEDQAAPSNALSLRIHCEALERRMMPI